MCAYVCDCVNACDVNAVSESVSQRVCDMCRESVCVCV